MSWSSVGEGQRLVVQQPIAHVSHVSLLYKSGQSRMYYYE
jgi:hypothetical protein